MVLAQSAQGPPTVVNLCDNAKKGFNPLKVCLYLP